MKDGRSRFVSAKLKVIYKIGQIGEISDMSCAPFIDEHFLLNVRSGQNHTGKASDLASCSPEPAAK